MHLVYFSAVPWASFAQRPHKFIEWLHARGANKVLWVNPYPTRLPELNDFYRIKSSNSTQEYQSNNTSTPKWLTVLNPKSLPIEPLLGSKYINRFFWNDILQKIDVFTQEKECLICIGKPSDLALEALIRHPKTLSLYDAMDDFPAFYSGLSKLSMTRNERKTANNVSQLLVSSSTLTERFAIHQAKLTQVFNACDTSMLPPITYNNKKPTEIVLGYIGTIGHWFDWDLIFSLAEANSSMCIRLIGPIFVLPKKKMPPNIDLLPACDHATAIQAMQSFSIGLIPFKCTELTSSVDPIKYYEYRSLGLPIISSSFGEMSLRSNLKGVFFIDKHSDLNGVTKQALTYKCQNLEIQKFRIENSWEARFNAIRNLPYL